MGGFVIFGHSRTLDLIFYCIVWVDGGMGWKHVKEGGGGGGGGGGGDWWYDIPRF